MKWSFFLFFWPSGLWSAPPPGPTGHCGPDDAAASVPWHRLQAKTGNHWINKCKQPRLIYINMSLFFNEQMKVTRHTFKVITIYKIIKKKCWIDFISIINVACRETCRVLACSNWFMHQVCYRGMMGWILQKKPGSQTLFAWMCWPCSSIETNRLPYWTVLELLDDDRRAGRPEPQGDPWGLEVCVFWPRVVTQGAVSAPWKCKRLLACTIAPLNYRLSCWVPAHSCLPSRRVWHKEAEHASDQDCRSVCKWGR